MGFYDQAGKGKRVQTWCHGIGHEYKRQTLRSGTERHPARMMFSSEAHHSAIMSMPGSASRRNGRHSEVAALTLHPVQVVVFLRGVRRDVLSSSSTPSFFQNLKYPTFIAIITPLLVDVAIAAPFYSQPTCKINS